MKVVVIIMLFGGYHKVIRWFLINEDGGYHNVIRWLS